MPGTPGDSGYSPAQLAYARTIVSQGQKRGASRNDIETALMVALAESDLQNYANSSVPESLGIPHDAVGSDHASVGIFQQQVGIWGNARELMDPAASADKFFSALSRVIKHSADEPPWVRAQAVQKSAFPDGRNYQARYADAQALMAAVDGGYNPTRGTVPDAAPGSPAAIMGSWAASLSSIGALFSDPAFWRRAGLFALGAVLVAVALWQALGGTDVAKAAAKMIL